MNVIFRHLGSRALIWMLVWPLTSCVHQEPGIELTSEMRGVASPVVGSSLATQEWKSFVFCENASARFLSQNPERFCEIDPGHSLMIGINEGCMIPLTTNFVQFWTVLLCLPSDLPPGNSHPLYWNPPGDCNTMRPGQVAICAVQGMGTGLDLKHPNTRLGEVTLLERRGSHLKLHLSIQMPFREGGPSEWRVYHVRINRDFDAVLRHPTVNAIDGSVLYGWSPAKLPPPN